MDGERRTAPDWRRWAAVFAAAMFINTSYGTLSYAFSVLVTRSAAGRSFGTGTVSLGFSLALLVSGFAAIGVGTIADIASARRLMAGGAVAGAAGLCLLAACQESWQFIAVMMLVVGPAMAATFYEPVYVLMNRWFDERERPRAYGVLTLSSGFSITIFTPLSRWLVDDYGWRQGVIVLAAILLCVGLLVPAILPEGEGRPLASGARGRGGVRRFLSESRDGLRHTDTPFWLFTAAFFCATVAFSGFSFHMVAQLETRGFEAAPVAAAIGITGIVSLPARLFLPALSHRVSAPVLLGACLVLLGLAAAIASAASGWWQVWVYVGVFGSVFGAVYPLRALVTSERFAGPYFGRVIGLQALVVAMARASGPVAIGLFGTSRAGYELGFRVAAVALVVSAIAGLWAARLGRTDSLPSGDGDPAPAAQGYSGGGPLTN